MHTHTSTQLLAGIEGHRCSEGHDIDQVARQGAGFVKRERERKGEGGAVVNIKLHTDALAWLVTPSLFGLSFSFDLSLCSWKRREETDHKRVILLSLTRSLSLTHTHAHTLVCWLLFSSVMMCWQRRQREVSSVTMYRQHRSHFPPRAFVTLILTRCLFAMGVTLDE